jgi:hypothetical protein
MVETLKLMLARLHTGVYRENWTWGTNSKFATGQNKTTENLERVDRLLESNPALKHTSNIEVPMCIVALFFYKLTDTFT